MGIPITSSPPTARPSHQYSLGRMTTLGGRVLCFPHALTLIGIAWEDGCTAVASVRADEVTTKQKYATTRGR